MNQYVEYMITKGNFQVSIQRYDPANPGLPHQFVRTIPNTYAAFYCMKDNDTYAIYLNNNGPTKCDAKITIDGELIGVWRIKPRTPALVKAPVCVNRCLVFKNSASFSADTSSGRFPENGKISVEFLPEMGCTADVAVPYHDSLYPVKLNGQNGSFHELNTGEYGTGTTVLGNVCPSNLDLVDLIKDIDHTNKQIIDVWLVEDYGQVS
jgi:hypothetical protein